MTMNGSPFKEDEVIPMSITCTKCGCTVHNDLASVRHPLDFLDAMRERGWYIPSVQISQQPTSGNKPHTCAKCVSSS